MSCALSSQQNSVKVYPKNNKKTEININQLLTSSKATKGRKKETHINTSQQKSTIDRNINQHHNRSVIRRGQRRKEKLKSMMQIPDKPCRAAHPGWRRQGGRNADNPTADSRAVADVQQGTNPSLFPYEKGYAERNPKLAYLCLREANVRARVYAAPRFILL